MTTTETCAHDACRCTKPYSAQTQAASTSRIDPDGTYCSKRCEQQAAGTPSDDGCECGHPQCSAAMDTGIPPMQ
jgi:hypothetical protein